MADPNITVVPMVRAVPVHPDPSSSMSPYSTASSLPGPSNPSPYLSQEQVNQLQAQGFPVGLAAEMGRTRTVYPVRFWVVDNSGSMNTPDGSELRAIATKDHHGSNQFQVVPCTRWKELQGSLCYHIQLAGFLEASTMFRMLNNPGRSVGPQEFMVSGGNADQVQQAVNIVQAATPRGVTPLAKHLEAIRSQIVSMETELRNNDQQAVIVLATDGLPSDDQGHSSEAVLRTFVDSLKNLQSLPVWIVVRLCTDDEGVVDYYNSLDQELELPIEVIDDFFGEAKEIHSKNKWLNYGLPMHRCREMGYHHKLFDLLDEQLLLKDQLLEFVQLLFGNAYQWPDPHAQWKEFVAELEHVLEVQAPQYNPITRKVEPWIDIKQLRRCYEKRSGGSVFGLFGKKK